MQSFSDRSNSALVPTWVPRRNGSALPLNPETPGFSSSQYQRSSKTVSSNAHQLIHGREEFPASLNSPVDPTLFEDSSTLVLIAGDDAASKAYSKSTLIQVYKDMISNDALGNNPLPTQHPHVIADRYSGPLALEPLTTTEHEILHSGKIFPEHKKYDPTRNSRSGHNLRAGAHASRLRRTDRTGLIPAVISPSKSSHTDFKNSITDPQGSFVDITGIKVSKSMSPVVRSAAPSQIGTDTASHAGSVTSDVWSTAATGAVNGDQAMSDVASVTWSRQSRSRSPSVVHSRGSIVNSSMYAPDRTATPSDAPPGLSGIIHPTNVVPSRLGHPPTETWTLVEWYYRDPTNMVQGPFSAEQMQEWYTSQYFGTDLLVKATFRSNLGVTADSGPFCPLDGFATRFCRGELVTPFISARYSPTHTPLDPASLSQQPFSVQARSNAVSEPPVPHFYDPFSGSSPGIAGLRDPNIATASNPIHMYGTSGTPGLNVSTGASGPFQGLSGYRPLDNVPSTSITMSHHSSPEYASAASWNQHGAFESQPSVGGGVGGAWGPGYGTDPQIGMDPKTGNTAAINSRWTSSPGLGSLLIDQSKHHVSPVPKDHKTEAAPSPYLPLFGAKSVQDDSFSPAFRPAVQALPKLDSRPQSPSLKHAQVVHRSPIKVPAHEHNVTPSSVKSAVTSSLRPSVAAEAADVPGISLGISELVTNDMDASWPVHDSAVRNEATKKVSRSLDHSFPSHKAAARPQAHIDSDLPSSREIFVKEEISLSAWGAKEDAAAAAVWASAHIPPASDHWSTTCTPARTLVSASGSPVSVQGGSSDRFLTSDFQVDTDPWDENATESPWLVKSNSNPHKMSGTTNQEAGRKASSKRDVPTSSASGGKNETMAWGSTATQAKQLAQGGALDSSSKPAWKQIEGSTKTFAEIQEEESRLEMQRQKRKAIEHERIMAAMVEVEAAADIRAKWASTTGGTAWGITPASVPTKHVIPSAPNTATKKSVGVSNGVKNTGAVVPGPTAGNEAWVTVRGGVKPVKSTAPGSSHSFLSAATRSNSMPLASTISVNTVAVAPGTSNRIVIGTPATLPKSKPISVTPVHAKKEISEETAKWIASALKKVPGLGQLLPSLLSMLTEFGVSDLVASNTVTTVASLILDMSTVVDSRAFAAEFVKRRRLDLGLSPTWTVAVKKNSAVPVTSSAASSSSMLNGPRYHSGGGASKGSDVGFQVVSKKKKGGKRN